MTEVPPATSKGFKRMGCAILALILLFLFPLLDLGLQLAKHLLFGWVPYLFAVLPRVTFNPEIFMDFAVALLLGVALLHRLLVRWARRVEGVLWNFPATIKVAAAVLLLFATSIAATGIVHQLGWLARADTLTYDAAIGVLTRDQSTMKSTYAMLHLFEQETGHLPRDLISLVPDYLPNRRDIFSRAVRDEPPELFLYFPDHRGADPAKIILLATPTSISGKRAVCLRNGATQRMTEAEYQELLNQQAVP